MVGGVGGEMERGLREVVGEIEGGLGEGRAVLGEGGLFLDHNFGYLADVSLRFFLSLLSFLLYFLSIFFFLKRIIFLPFFTFF